MSSNSISRRGSLGLMAAAGAMGAARPSEAAEKAHLLDLTKREDFFEAVLKMRACKDADMRMGYIVGNYYGIVDAAPIPLFRMIAGTFSRFHKRPDGNYEGISFELAYYTDWETGDLLETYRNPLNGKTVKVQQLMRIGPDRTIYAPDSIHREAGRLPAGLNTTHRILPARVVGDDVWFVEENVVTPTPEAKMKLSYGEVTTYQSSLKAISDPKVTRALTHIHFTMNIGWRPWLEMGDSPGHLFGDGTGRHIDRVADFPTDFASLSRKHCPTEWNDPDAVLAKYKPA